MGRIADIAKSNIPVIWDAAAGDERLGDSTLTARETYITYLIFADALDETQQDALSPLVAEYAGKALAIEVIDASLDFWMVQTEVATTRQPFETESFPDDRLAYLQAKKADLLADLLKLEPLVAPEIPTVFDKKNSQAPLLSSIDDDLLTPSPQDFGPIYAPPEG